jgi:hypothetical protein
MAGSHAVNDAEDEPQRKAQRIELALLFLASCRDTGTESGLRFKGEFSTPLERRKFLAWAKIHHRLSAKESLLFIV